MRANEAGTASTVRGHGMECAWALLVAPVVAAAKDGELERHLPHEEERDHCRRRLQVVGVALAHTGVRRTPGRGGYRASIRNGSVVGQ